jgi:hypothetical protein
MVDIRENNHVLMDNWRPDEKVGGNQTGLWGASSFLSVSVKDQSLLVPFVITHASHLAGRIKYLSIVKLVTLFGPGQTQIGRLVTKGLYGDAKSKPKVRPGSRAVPGLCGP